MARFSNLEDFLGFGWYQIFHAIFIQLVIIVESFNMIMMTFAGSIPKLHCEPSWNASDWESEEGQKRACQLLANQSCGSLSMVSAFGSISQQWGLICDRVNLVYLIMSVQMIGVFIGAPLFGQISDILGRKKGLAIAFCALVVFGLGSAFSADWIQFAVFRFFIGLCCGGVQTTMYVFLVEFLQPRHRFWVTSVFNWPTADMVIALVAYLARDWQSLALYGNLLGILVIGLFWFAKESPRWLIQKGKRKEAFDVLQSLASWNGLTWTQEEMETMMEKTEKKSKKGLRLLSFWHLCYSRTLTKYSTILAFSWFTISAVTYTVLLGLAGLSGSPFLNLFLYGAMRFVIVVLVGSCDIFLSKLGRKAYHTIYEGIIVLCWTVIASIFIFRTETWIQESLNRWLSMLGVVCTGPLWLVVYMLTAELYPTPIRNLANSYCSAWGSIGAVVAPQFVYMGYLWRPSPFILLGSLTLVDVILFRFLIPETKGRPLPEQMPDQKLSQCSSMGGLEAIPFDVKPTTSKRPNKHQETEKSLV